MEPRTFSSYVLVYTAKSTQNAKQFGVNVKLLNCIQEVVASNLGRKRLKIFHSLPKVLNALGTHKCPHSVSIEYASFMVLAHFRCNLISVDYSGVREMPIDLLLDLYTGYDRWSPRAPIIINSPPFSLPFFVHSQTFSGPCCCQHTELSLCDTVH